MATEVPQRRPPGRGLSPSAVAALVGLAGLVITLVVSWTAWTLNRHNEHRLLRVDTRQASAVLDLAILELRDPLATALQVASATDGNVRAFDAYLGADVGAGKLFVSASLWDRSGSGLRRVTSLGGAPYLSPSSTRAQTFLAAALRSSTFQVTSIRIGHSERVGYAFGNPAQPTFVVYAERAIPADREAPVEKGSAFSDLNYATYLGSSISAANLATTDIPPSQLPITGDTAEATLPFGNTSLILVTEPRGDLGGTFGADLPWIFLGAGVLLTLGAAAGSRQLVSGRRRAEGDAATISGLYDRLDGLYGEQRAIAQTLKHALLPQSDLRVSEVDVATRYVAGAEEVDVGGDWYSVDAVDEGRIAFVVGDVSGKGVAAAAVMARLRFTLRAYLLEGHAPDVTLRKCADQLDIDGDEHLATVLVGVADLRTGELALANAGHFNPLLVVGGQASFVGTAVGPPLGTGWPDYPTTTTTFPSGGTLIAFTDGLVERRGESIDQGLDRLASTAATPATSLEDLLDEVVAQMSHGKPEDDIAILAIRWRPADAELSAPVG